MKLFRYYKTITLECDEKSTDDLIKNFHSRLISFIKEKPYNYKTALIDRYHIFFDNRTIYRIGTGKSFEIKIKKGKKEIEISYSVFLDALVVFDIFLIILILAAISFIATVKSPESLISLIFPLILAGVIKLIFANGKEEIIKYSLNIPEF